MQINLSNNLHIYLDSRSFIKTSITKKTFYASNVIVNTTKSFKDTNKIQSCNE